MKLEQGDFCPFVKGKCKRTDCMMFMQISGKHPVTNEHIDEWDCVLRWQIALTMENTKSIRGTQAATESMRNEIVRRMDVPQNVNGHANGQLDLIDAIGHSPKLIGPQ